MTSPKVEPYRHKAGECPLSAHSQLQQRNPAQPRKRNIRPFSIQGNVT